eukprot:g6341.t1
MLQIAAVNEGLQHCLGDRYVILPGHYSRLGQRFLYVKTKMWVHRDCSPKEGETCDGGEEANGRQVSALVSTVEMEDLSTDKVYEVSHIEAMEMASGVRYDRTGLRYQASNKYSNTMPVASRNAEGAKMDERTRLRSQEPLLDARDDQPSKALATPVRPQMMDNNDSALCKRPKLALAITLCVFFLLVSLTYLPANDGSGEELIEHSVASNTVAIVTQPFDSSATAVAIPKQGKQNSPEKGKDKEDTKQGKRNSPEKGKDKEAKEGKGKTKHKKAEKCTQGSTCEVPAYLLPGWDFYRNYSLGFNGFCGDFDKSINFQVSDFPADLEDFQSTLPYAPNALVKAVVDTMSGPVVLTWAAVVVMGAVTGSFNSICALDGTGVCEGASLILQSLVTLGSATLLDHCIFGFKFDRSGSVQNCPGFDSCLAPTNALAVAEAKFVAVGAPYHVTDSLDPGCDVFGNYFVTMDRTLGTVTTDGQSLRLEYPVLVEIMRVSSTLPPIGKFYPNAIVSATFVGGDGEATFTWDAVVVAGMLTTTGEPACVEGIPKGSQSCAGLSILLHSTSNPTFWDGCSFVAGQLTGVLQPVNCPQAAPLLNGNGEITFYFRAAGRRRLTCDSKTIPSEDACQCLDPGFPPPKNGFRCGTGLDQFCAEWQVCIDTSSTNISCIDSPVCGDKDQPCCERRPCKDGLVCSESVSGICVESSPSATASSPSETPSCSATPSVSASAPGNCTTGSGCGNPATPCCAGYGCNFQGPTAGSCVLNGCLTPADGQCLCQRYNCTCNHRIGPGRHKVCEELLDPSEL